MKIQIELIVVIFAVLILSVWAIWYNLTTWIARKRYKIDNDKSRHGEEKRRKTNGGERESSRTVGDSTGLTDIKPRELLQVSTPDEPGKDSQQPRETGNSNGKTGKFRRNPFRRRK